MFGLPIKTLLLAGVVGLVIAAAVLLRMVVQQTDQQPVAQQPTATVVAAESASVQSGYVVAARDITRGSSIDAAGVRLSALKNPPADGITALDLVVGHVALDSIHQGAPITTALISPQADFSGVASLIPPQYRAVTLRVTEDNGVGYLIRPGDHVDVALVTHDERSERDVNRVTPPDLSRIVLQDVLVLAVGDALSADPTPGQPVRNTQPMRNVTLAALPEQLLLLGLSRGDGGYVLALRNPVDKSLAPDDLRVSRTELLGNQPEQIPAPPPVNVAPPPQPRLIRSGPEIVRGPIGANR